MTTFRELPTSWRDTIFGAEQEQKDTTVHQALEAHAPALHAFNNHGNAHATADAGTDAAIAASAALEF